MGGGFTGGIKHNPEIIKMANYYASRGWVFYFHRLQNDRGPVILRNE